jgi:hypothetical protein
MPKPRVKTIPLGFDKNVFINCPFDNKYLPLFRAIIFTVHDMGFRARCALEASNAGNVRIDKVQDIIAAHGGTQRGIVNEVREWLRPELDPRRFVILSGAEILTRFRKFKRALPSICFRLHWDPDRLGFVDYAYAVASWISTNRP